MRIAFALIAPCMFIGMAKAADEAPIAAAQVAATVPQSNATSARAQSSDTKANSQSEAKADTGPKELSGISILGNQEAPKALVIVPWKSSKLGDPQGISKQLDDGRQPVDKDVFMRELSYYEIRTGTR